MAELRPLLVVMVKSPIAGGVKTRLARRIGTVEALRFYRAATARLLRRLGRDPRWRTVLAVAPDHETRGRFWPPTLASVPQGRGDLGARMLRLFGRGAGGPVVIVGSDIPDVAAAHVAAAFRLLGRHDLVFGPAEDGGFWLVGARRGACLRGLFDDVRWSGEHALRDTLRTARGTVGFAAALADVDTEADWLRWRRAGVVSARARRS